MFLPVNCSLSISSSLALLHPPCRRTAVLHLEICKLLLSFMKSLFLSKKIGTQNKFCPLHRSLIHPSLPAAPAAANSSEFSHRSTSSLSQQKTAPTVFSPHHSHGHILAAFCTKTPFPSISILILFQPMFLSRNSACLNPKPLDTQIVSPDSRKISGRGQQSQNCSWWWYNLSKLQWEGD